MAFTAEGIEAVFEKVVAVVVQPGLEFGNEGVVHFDGAAAAPLAAAVAGLAGVVYEAHSTDYQRPSAYAALVRAHFAILKVGPAATFALREALFALEGIESELVETGARSQLSAVLEAEMLASPAQWEGHYSGTSEQQRYLRRFSFSDRIRYYWTAPAVRQAVAALFANIDRAELPVPLVSQFFPQHLEAVRAGAVAGSGVALCQANVRAALLPYALAAF